MTGAPRADRRRSRTTGREGGRGDRDRAAAAAPRSPGLAGRRASRPFRAPPRLRRAPWSLCRRRRAASRSKLSRRRGESGGRRGGLGAPSRSPRLSRGSDSAPRVLQGEERPEVELVGEDVDWRFADDGEFLDVGRAPVAADHPHPERRDGGGGGDCDNFPTRSARSGCVQPRSAGWLKRSGRGRQGPCPRADVTPAHRRDHPHHPRRDDPNVATESEGGRVTCRRDARSRAGRRLEGFSFCLLSAGRLTWNGGARRAAGGRRNRRLKGLAGTTETKIPEAPVVPVSPHMSLVAADSLPSQVLHLPPQAPLPRPTPRLTLNH